MGQPIAGEDGFAVTEEISLGRAFPRPPKVVASLAGFVRSQQGAGDTYWALKTEVRAVTDTTASVFLQGEGTKVDRLDIAWVACM